MKERGVQLSWARLLNSGTIVILITGGEGCPTHPRLFTIPGFYTSGASNTFIMYPLWLGMVHLPLIHWLNSRAGVQGQPSPSNKTLSLTNSNQTASRYSQIIPGSKTVRTSHWSRTTASCHSCWANSTYSHFLFNMISSAPQAFLLPLPPTHNN